VAGGEITFTAQGTEILALQKGTLTFPAPMADRGRNSAGFEFYWGLLTYVFNLEDPANCPPWRASPTAEEADILRRFVTCCREMAESEMLNDKQEVSFKVSAGEPVIERSLSSKEVMRGFVVLFRQMYADDDEASFRKVHRLLSRLNEAVDDEHTPQRRELLKSWRRAEGKLRADRLRVLALAKLQEEGETSPPPGPVHQDPSPTELISAYNYGDLIHWGKGKNALSSYSHEPFDEARRVISFLESVAGLCHLYMGFGVLIESLEC